MNLTIIFAVAPLGTLPKSHEIVRVSGVCEQVALADTAVADARGRGCRVVAAVPRDGQSVFEVDLTGPVAVLIGGEGQGLSPSLVDAADVCVTIPMQPPVDSLNAAVTAAIILYEVRRQRLA